MIAGHFIGGVMIAEGEVGESLNPADQTVLGQFYYGSAQLVDQAASQARAAFFGLDWAANPRLRGQVLTEIANQLEAEKDSIADLIVLENGKLFKEAIGETLGAISETRYYAGLARNIRGTMQEVLPNVAVPPRTCGCGWNNCAVERACDFADAFTCTSACSRLYKRGQACRADTLSACKNYGMYSQVTLPAEGCHKFSQ
jgi:acyl-CoA reductase-like NAD-dependent aldehyde dehydrogenase